MQNLRRNVIIAGIVLLLIIIGIITYFHVWPYVPIGLWVLLNVGAVFAIVVIFRRMRGATRYSLIAGVGVLVLLIDGIIFAAIHNAWLDILYVALIIAAAFTLAVAALQIYTIVKLIRTISMVRDEMKPLLASVQETVGLVKETAKNANQTVATIGTAVRFTSDFAVQPSVRVVAFLVAAQQVIHLFMGKGHVRSRADQRRKQRMEAEAVVGGE